MRFNNDSYYLKSREEMEELFPEDRKPWTTPWRLQSGAMCSWNSAICFCRNFPCLRERPWTVTCGNSAKRGFPPGIRRTTHRPERMEYELGIIRQMGYSGYFLIVWDFINYSRRHDIPVGPGRGSAAGSIVAYLTGITSIDPLKYNLIFERFLNPERVSMPDIDTDICYVKRHLVVDYLARKYGESHVARSSPSGPWPPKPPSRTWAGPWTSP